MTTNNLTSDMVYTKLSRFTKLPLNSVEFNKVPLTDGTSKTFTILYRITIPTEKYIKDSMYNVSMDEFIANSGFQCHLHAVNYDSITSLPKWNKDLTLAEMFELAATGGVNSYSDKIPDSEIRSYIENNKDLDEFFKGHQFSFMAVLLGIEHISNLTDVDVDKFKELSRQDEYMVNDIKFNFVDINNNYTGKKYLKSMFKDLVKQSTNDNTIPNQYLPNAPKNIVLESVSNYINDVMANILIGAPVTAVIGPTGSGKSMISQYIGWKLGKGQNKSPLYGTLTIDFSENSSSDAIFYREDFTPDGTFVLEGLLPTFVRIMNKQNKRGLVILEEFNSAPDSIRREFYRLFNNDNSRYIQIPKKSYLRDEKSKRIVKAVTTVDEIDASNIQFMLLANPVTSDQYLTDDINSFSNAEIRRIIKFIYQDYCKDLGQVENIMKAIISKFPGFALLQKPEEVMDSIDWCMMNQMHLAFNINKPKELTHDFGYTPLAHLFFTAALEGNSKEAMVRNCQYNLINPLSTLKEREIVSDLLQAQFSINIDDSVLEKGL